MATRDMEHEHERNAMQALLGAAKAKSEEAYNAWCGVSKMPPA
jgi:hypothetical protein